MGPKPAVTPAREGRELQRYGDDGQRLTAGCVVLREGSGKSRECLMITSTKDTSRWVFPKGGWELDETLEEAAQRETLEEAGVKVQLGRQMGWFECGGGSKSIVCFFEAVCLEQLDDWAEAPRRQRQWIPLEEAKQVCKHEYVKDVLEVL